MYPTTLLLSHHENRIHYDCCTAWPTHWHGRYRQSQGHARQTHGRILSSWSITLQQVNYYHIKTTDDRVFQRVSRSRYTRAFRTEISAMAASLGWSESKCVNYVQRKIKDKQRKPMKVETTYRFANRLVTAWRTSSRTQIHTIDWYVWLMTRNLQHNAGYLLVPGPVSSRTMMVSSTMQTMTTPGVE